MKIKYYVCKCETHEAEIDDKFAPLAVSHPWEHPELTDELYEECILAVEKATGLSFNDREREYIMGVWSAENDETILEL